MKTKLNLEKIIEEHSNEYFCSFCIKPRDPANKCCDDAFFILLSDLDSSSQLKTATEIVKKGG